jgi:hypothetical protein
MNLDTAALQACIQPSKLAGWCEIDLSIIDSEGEHIGIMDFNLLADYLNPLYPQPVDSYEPVLVKTEDALAMMTGILDDWNKWLIELRDHLGD